MPEETIAIDKIFAVIKKCKIHAISKKYFNRSEGDNNNNNNDNDNDIFNQFSSALPMCLPEIIRFRPGMEITVTVHYIRV